MLKEFLVSIIFKDVRFKFGQLFNGPRYCPEFFAIVKNFEIVDNIIRFS